MRTSFKNIDDLIKKQVAYYIKEWCADIHYDGSLKYLPLHPLVVAKHVATNLGYNKRDVYSQEHVVTAHLRTYSNIMELNEKEAKKIPHIIYDFENNNPDTNFGYRYVMLIEATEKQKYMVPYYFDCGAADDTVILFLVENDYGISYEFHNRSSEDDCIRRGKIIAAVELGCCIPFISYMDYPDLTPSLFRKTFKELLDSGKPEMTVYKETVQDHTVWKHTIINDIVLLYQQYALQNLDDTKFMHEITSTLPQPAIFESTSGYEAYSEISEKIKQIKLDSANYKLVKL